MISSLPGVKHGAAHYKYLEQGKINALKISKGCFDVMMNLSPQPITDVKQRFNRINCSKNNITKGEPVIEISSDASSFEWGAANNDIRTRGAFNLDKTLLSDKTANVHGINNTRSNK